jgi:NADH:ubiquinone oxidoreductase subunit D
MSFMLMFLIITFLQRRCLHKYGIVDLPFQIVMGEVPVPVAEIYHPVEGGNGELGFYLVTDGSRTLSIAFLRPCFIYYQAYPEMIKGALLSDAIVFCQV